MKGLDFLPGKAYTLSLLRGMVEFTFGIIKDRPIDVTKDYIKDYRDKFSIQVLVLQILKKTIVPTFAFMLKNLNLPKEIFVDKNVIIHPIEIGIVFKRLGWGGG